MMSDPGVERFFDELTKEYTATIERCFPRYREMLWALLDYLPPQHPVETVLELGCGTGNLSVMLREAWPAATLQLVDVSRESLDACRQRLESQRCLCEQADFRDLSYPPASFDLILSSIAVHHLTAEEKRKLFRNVARWLRDGGIFCYADQCAGASPDLYARHIHNWKQLSQQAGASDEEWAMWMEHQREHDHHDTLPDQLDWLRAAGFSMVDCPWRYLLWSVIQARKHPP